MLSQDKAREILRELKDKFGLTLTEISQQTLISRSHLSAFIKGTTNFKRKKLESLEKFIKIYYSKGDFNYEF